MAFPSDDLDVIVYAHMGADPTADPGTWPAATDLSARLLDEPITIITGRQPGQRTLSAGSCTFTLHNEAYGDGLGEKAAGVLTPELATSPFYDLWDVGAPVQLLVDNVGASPPYSLVCGFVAAVDTVIVPRGDGTMVSAVKVTLGGVVRRIGQGSVARTPMRRFVDRETPIGYWPLGGITYSAIGGTDASISSTTITGPCDSGAETSVAMDVVFRGDPGSASETVILRQVRDGYTVWIVASWNSGSPTISITDFGIFPLDTGTSEQAAAMFDGAPHHWRFVVAQNGSDVDVSAYLDGDLIMSGTATGETAGAGFVLCQVASQVASDTTDLAVWAGANTPDIADAAAAGLAYAGELAHERIGRICDEEKIPFSSSATSSRPCGRQPTADVLAILRDAETVDHGVIAEDRTTWGLTYLSGDERYNQAAAMTVDLSTYRVTGGTSPADVLTPVRNDQRTRNEWTISRPDGGEATVVDTAHQAKRGRYNDSAEVNVEDDTDLVHEAGWRVWEGTQTGPRYRSMPLDLGANSSADGSDDLLGDWLEMDLGARIDRTNPPLPHPHDDARLTLEGYTQTIRPRSWTVAPVVEPYEPWNVRELAEDTDPDSNVYVGRWAEEVGTVLDEAIDADDTSFDVDVAGGEWTQDPDEFDTDLGVGLFIEVGGEVMQVAGIAESGGVWTFTVVRSINSVTKAHSAGAALKVVDAQIWAL